MASYETDFASTPEVSSDTWTLQGSLLSKNGRSFVVLDDVKRGVYGSHLADGTRTHWLELATGSLKPPRIIVAWKQDEPAIAIDSAFHELVTEVAARLAETDSPVRFNQSEGHPPWRPKVQLLISALVVFLIIVVLFGLGGLWQIPIGVALVAGGVWWWRQSRSLGSDALTPTELIDHVSTRIARKPGS